MERHFSESVLSGIQESHQGIQITPPVMIVKSKLNAAYGCLYL